MKTNKYITESNTTTNEEKTGDATEDAPETDTGSDLLPPEPWDRRVNGDAMISEIKGVIQRHTVMTDQEQLALALWIVNSHCHDLGRHSPFLAFQSPTMRCGKSTALTMTSALVPKPMAVAHVTGPSLYRMIHEHSPTVLVDELDQVIHHNKDLRAVLNTAHNKQTAFVPRVVQNAVVRFRVFSPKVLACIGKLPDTLQDRSIIINLRRKRPADVVEPLPAEPVTAYSDATRRIARWVMDHRHLIAKRLPKIPTGLNDRAGDNWRQLLAIAEVLGPRWAKAACVAAIEISRAADFESVDPAEQLIRDIDRIFRASHGAQQLPVDFLHAALVDLDGGMWAEFDHNQSLTKARLGRMLIPFGVHSVVARVGAKVVRVYRRDSFADAFSRYCAAGVKAGRAA
jgi:putative DNA primase/helicase